ncbi:hypothetical protein D7X96_17415 [Corallococcus interemptor]|uniref:Zinc finger/thioredoxin putative domain-containing protein n=1 Tax=Corallococcus interemptor TaxID=2316720 RepID=A0A3A8QKW4_9BACT|nr:zinc-ribbon domain-containing protein [Corallococcus interemptor]RKH68458.1 hypothetical protein D7X96_17415 [Corallococcus interemptor]
MIVQCEQCQTRFKIPDEKVTEKGVKVRCTKCQNTFRVAREPAPALSAPPPAGPPAGQPDPFHAFGEAPEPTGEVTRPGPAYYAPGAPAVKSQVNAWGDVDLDIDVDASPGAGAPMMPFDPPTPSPGVASRRPTAPLASPTNLAGLDLEDPFADFMADAPAPGAPVAAPRPAVAPPAPPAPRPAPPGAFAPPAARAAPPGAFAAGPGGAPRPAAVAPEAAVASRGPVPPGAVAPPAPGAFPARAAMPPAAPPGSAGPAPVRAAMPPAPAAPSSAAPARAAMPPAPATPPGGAAPGRAAMPGAPGAAPGMGAAPARTAPPPGPRAPVASPGLSAAGSTDLAPDPLFDFPIDAPAAPDAASLRHAANVAAAPAPGGASAVGPVTPAPGFASEDPFASIDMAAAPPQDLAGPPPEDLGAAAEPMGDLFDFSGAGASGEEGMTASDTGRAALLGDVTAEAGAEDAGGISLLSDVPAYDDGDPFKITTPRREVVDLAPLRSGPAVTVAKPSARIEDVGMPQRRLPGRARKLTGLVLNLAIATVLVVALGALGAVYLREGRVDPSTLSPDRLRTLVLPASRPFVASDVSNGLYETRDGRMLFVVRGEAENRTGAAAAVRVRAALFDGDQRVRSTEGLAGALATPEELHAVTTREAATALRQRMDAASLPVPPGGKVPFLVMFQEFPADLSGFRLEVTLEPVPSEPTADRTGG